jgi:FKBP-type peptidyl-prolyl cis-trans isomerase
MDRGIQIVEDVAGDGTVVQRDELVTLDLQITLNRGEVVHPRERMTVRVGDRRVFPGLSKSIEGMRRGGYRKTRVSAHLAYGLQGIPGKVPPGAVLVCELWVLNSRTTAALVGGEGDRWRPAG